MNIKEQMLLTDEEIDKIQEFPFIADITLKRQVAKAQADKCLSKFKEMIGEMTKLNDVQLVVKLMEVIIDSPKSKEELIDWMDNTIKQTAKAQLHHSQQEILEKINEL